MEPFGKNAYTYYWRNKKISIFFACLSPSTPLNMGLSLHKNWALTQAHLFTHIYWYIVISTTSHRLEWRNSNYFVRSTLTYSLWKLWHCDIFIVNKLCISSSGPLFKIMWAPASMLKETTSIERIKITGTVTAHSARICIVTCHPSV